MINRAYLFGPFFGELSWEYFRFAPYAIHLKKANPDINLIVMTRPERFDLYGQYSDILVPLKIENEDFYQQSGFRLNDFDLSLHKKICDIFRISYKKKYSIVDTFVPDVSSIRYKLKWQFPRSKMDYDFLPRQGNLKLVNTIYRKKDNVLVDTGYRYDNQRYNSISVENFKKMVMLSVDNMKTTYIGCLIQIIKRSNFVISNLTSNVGRLALLLKVPLIYPYREIDDDLVSLLNPLNTPIIDCESIIEGVRIYETM